MWDCRRSSNLEAGSTLVIAVSFFAKLVCHPMGELTITRSDKMRLADELLACGVLMPVDDFRERLVLRLTDWFSGRSIDGLVCEPTDSLRFCNGIRTELG